MWGNNIFSIFCCCFGNKKDGENSASYSKNDSNEKSWLLSKEGEEMMNNLRTLFKKENYPKKETEEMFKRVKKNASKNITKFQEESKKLDIDDSEVFIIQKSKESLEKEQIETDKIASQLSVGGNFNLAPPKNSNIKSTFNVKGNPGNLTTNTNAQIIITPNKSSNVNEGENEIDLQKMFYLAKLLTKRGIIKEVGTKLESKVLFLEGKENTGFYNNSTKFMSIYQNDCHLYEHELERKINKYKEFFKSVINEELKKERDDLKKIDNEIIHIFKK